jgi:hypothetical protein
MYGLPVGASEEGELHLVMDAKVSKPIHAFYLLSYCFFFQETSWGTLPWRGDNVTHKHFTEMRRLACDEGPFLLAMSPRATTLVR